MREGFTTTVLPGGREEKKLIAKLVPIAMCKSKVLKCLICDKLESLKIRDGDSCLVNGVAILVRTFFVCTNESCIKREQYFKYGTTALESYIDYLNSLTKTRKELRNITCGSYMCRKKECYVSCARHLCQTCYDKMDVRNSPDKKFSDVLPHQAIFRLERAPGICLTGGTKYLLFKCI
jgi:hypothetical protein